jgi:hypothetical protein
MLCDGYSTRCTVNLGAMTHCYTPKCDRFRRVGFPLAIRIECYRQRLPPLANDPVCKSRPSIEKLEGDLTSPEAMNTPLHDARGARGARRGGTKGHEGATKGQRRGNEETAESSTA